MTLIYVVYLNIAVAVAGVALSRGLGGRTFFAVMALCASVILAASAIGRAKPLWTETLCDTRIATVLGSQLREDEGTIYLWLQPEGCEPTAYRIAWSKELAQQIQDALDRAQGQGGSGTLLFERSYETREPKIYPMPQPALPPKPPAGPPAVVVPEQSA